MANRYPKISNCLSYQRYNENYAEVKDYLTDEIYYFGIEEAVYMKKLDGKTHPYDIETVLTENEIDSLIEALDSNDLLKETNGMNAGNGMFLKTVWEPKWTSSLKLTAFFCNKMLLFLWLPVLIIGSVLFQRNLLFMELDMIWLGIVIGLICGMIFHEFGHAFAGVSYGAKVFEMGVMTMCYIIPGAYVIMDKDSVRSKLQRVQIHAAGVEMNLLLAGIFLMLGSVFVNWGGVFLAAALQNLFLALMNLTFLKGLDGSAILSEFLGAEDIFETARAVIFSRKKRRALRKSGLSGSTAIAACYVVGAFQLTFPLFILLNILEVVVCFV